MAFAIFARWTAPRQNSDPRSEEQPDLKTISRRLACHQTRIFVPTEQADIPAKDQMPKFAIGDVGRCDFTRLPYFIVRDDIARSTPQPILFSAVRKRNIPPDRSTRIESGSHVRTEATRGQLGKKSPFKKGSKDRSK